MNNRVVKKFRLGTILFFRIHVRNSSDPEQPLATPGTSTKITLRQSDGVLAVNDQTMTTESTGVFTYAYQTATTDPRGVWMVSFKMVDSGQTTMTVPQDAVEMVP